MTRPRLPLSRRGQNAALAVLCLAELIVVLDNTIINIALPTLGREFGSSVTGLQWIVDAYTLTFAGFLLAAGKLGDKYGRQAVLCIGMVGFGVVSILAAGAPSENWLVMWRAVMGIFAAAVFPATLALISAIFPDPDRRQFAIGAWAAVAGVGIAAGPVVSGWLLAHFSWPAVFWVNVPVVVVGTIGAWLWVPESKSEVDERLDYVGAALSITGITIIVWSIIEAPRRGWLSAPTAATFFGGAAVLAAFVAWQHRGAFPLLDLGLFRIRTFAVPTYAIATAYFALFGFAFIFTMFFQSILGYDTLQTGVRMIPYAISIAIFAPLGIVATKYIGIGPSVSVGLLAMCGVFAIASTCDAHTSYPVVIVPMMALMGLGLAFVQSAATSSIMDSLRPDEAGAGAGVNDTSREVGGALGVAVLGSVLASYHATPLQPDTFVHPTGVASWVAVGVTATGAVVVAALMPRRIRPTPRTDAEDNVLTTDKS